MQRKIAAEGKDVRTKIKNAGPFLQTNQEKVPVKLFLNFMNKVTVKTIVIKCRSRVPPLRSPVQHAPGEKS